MNYTIVFEKLVIGMENMTANVVLDVIFFVYLNYRYFICYCS